MARRRAKLLALRKTPRNPRPNEPKALERSYTKALRGVVDRLRREIERALRPELDAARRADALADLDFGALRIRLAEIVDRAGPIVDAQGRALSTWSRDDLSRVLGVDVEDETPATRAALARFRRENVALIKSIAMDLHAEVRALVRDAVRSGRRVESLAEEIEARYGVGARRARLIARDQTLKAHADLTRIRHRDAGIEAYVWSTSRDERVRPMHVALEGRQFLWAEPPVTNPRGDRNHPGRDYQCRCVAIPVIPVPQE
jgi:SPP1 gp7 family putative phage head morphogenesis protein